MIKRLGQALMILGGGILLLALYLLFVSHFGVGIPCTFRFLTGFSCPGCGMTRAAFSILRLDFLSGFRYNALSVTAMPLLGVYLCVKGACWVLKGNNGSGGILGFSLWEKIFLLGEGVVIVGYSVLRNLF